MSAFHAGFPETDCLLSARLAGARQSGNHDRSRIFRTEIGKKRTYLRRLVDRTPAIRHFEGMPPVIYRRPFLISMPISMAFLGAYRVEARADSLSEIEARHGGRLGVFAIDTDTGRTLTHRADERFTMCSTFKGILAGQILSRVDAGHESLARLVHFNAHDLSTAGYPDFLCPITAAHVSEGALTVATLCQASVAASDNLAAILLMQSVGGPPGFNRFLRSLGDGITRSDRYEPASNSYDGLFDTTTPRAIIGSARKLLLGDVLKPSSRELLTNWMIDSTPGLRRLRASFPPNWVTGDKAGTYGPDETNDYAITWPPGRRPVLVAAYYNAPGMDLDLREAVLREVGTAVAALVE